MNKRLHVVIAGRVQGVFFRAYAKEEADSLGLTGWVKNLASGDVESVFEGDEASASAMLAWYRKGPALARVKAVDIREEPFSGEFTDFRIVY